MTPDLLNRIGEALYGLHFKPQLCEAVHWDMRGLQRYCSGAATPNEVFRARLRELLRTRYRELTDLIDELEHQP